MHYILSFLLITALSFSARSQTDTLTYDEILKVELLTELIQENTHGTVYSFETTVACERKDLWNIICIGDALPKPFYEYLEKARPTECLIYFDKILVKDADEKLIPLKGVIVKIK